MKHFLIGLLVIFGLMSGAFFAFAEEKTVCVEFEGIQYCESKTVLQFGEKEVPVNDPLALLNSIGSSQVEKIGLWEVYKYPPVIVELSSQLNMTEDKLIYTLRDANDAWASLYHLVEMYPELSKKVKIISNDSTVHRLFSHIIEEITADIEEQLQPFAGSEV